MPGSTCYSPLEDSPSSTRRRRNDLRACNPLTPAIEDALRISHLGGMEGFGRVPIEDDGAEYEPFHATWEARIFGMMRVLASKGAFSLDEFRDVVESLPPDRYLSSEYYERWVDALEILTERGFSPTDGSEV